MSRGLDLDRDDERAREEEDERRAKEARGAHRLLRDDDARDPDRRSEQLPSRDFALPDGREREIVHLRAWGCRLRDTEGRTLVAAGAFRMVFERDLRDGIYRGDAERLAQDVKALRAQGLLDRRTLAVDDRGHSMGVLALTERGRALLEAQRYRDPDDGPAQAVYSGWHKPAEVIHDASLYRMFQVEAAAIEDRGGRIDRVVLDDELKRDVYARANRSRFDSDDERQEALAAAARAGHLPIIEGHVEFPDLRIEYETAAGERGRVDLELVTSAYHGGHLAGKQAAGFTLYSAGGSAGRGIHSLGGGGGGGVPGHERYLSSLLSL
jgi:hypothetical protein